MSSIIPPSPGRTILTTFAGRRDRMALLERYARAALDRGLIDEWHVWDFARNAEDRAWLEARFPDLRMTPTSNVFAPTGRILDLRAAETIFDFAVSSADEVHLGLKHLDGIGPCIDITLGGWGNNGCAILVHPSAAALFAVDDATTMPIPQALNVTPGILTPYRYLPGRLVLRANSIQAWLGEKLAVELDIHLGAGRFALFLRSGPDERAAWKLPPGGPDDGVHRYWPGVAKAEMSFPWYQSYYKHYARHVQEHGNDVILKCDDDIVFVDLDRLADFVAHRRAHHEHFMTSANVVNNGVCAHVQQSLGVLPPELGEFELPPKGFKGSLWESGAKAAGLHAHFLADPGRFCQAGDIELIWNERISINFVAIMGADFAHVGDILLDDEPYMSYEALWRSKKTNAIYPGFTAVHLSFWQQSQTMNETAILDGYAALANRYLGKEGRAKAPGLSTLRPTCE
ncbi:hypothetical protein SAMN07250955_10125 [Arboricoccus pini]|uniref:Uncharacterized protein n=1 Tax=Arboricoccus pini TaxID=1963835 RepID=A0A212PVQ1_9PROT|nr:hypothetical protein [Arboricoccus pini]SNB51051.1 hypothetical protein SAMN07250955_10125 [Arboricoccus pini]